MSLIITKMFIMKKFALIYHGYETSTPELAEAWSNWFQRRAVSFADVGNRRGPGRQITNEATIELSLSSNPQAATQSSLPSTSMQPSNSSKAVLSSTPSARTRPCPHETTA